MIIVRLSGGLGNQLFQYALGRALAHSSGSEVRFDTHAFAHEPGREFALAPFNVEAPLATSGDFRKIGIPDPGSRGLFDRLRRKALTARDAKKPLSERRFISEPSFTFHPDILTLTQDCYLSGVWQSEKYFTGIADELRKEIALRNPNVSFEEWKDRIDTTKNSVSLHVRRGDYASNAKTSAFHGTMDLSYYQRALEAIQARVGSDLTLYVFSDDTSWVREHLPLPYPAEYVSDGSLSDAEELILMSSCTHHNLANSTFSWWGAWLGEREGSITVAPQQWFKADIDTKDLIPTRWLRA